VTTVVAPERPRPVLDRERERRLTERQRQILDQLGTLFEEGFASLTMADIAARVRCSLRTLYTLAPSRDELVLLVVDRHLWRVGRAAQSAIAGDPPPLDALRTYLHAATVAVSRTTEPLARDIAAMPAARELVDGHREHLCRVTQSLLDTAVARGDIADVDTAAVARVLAGVGRDLARPEVIPSLRTSPKAAADEVVDLILKGLAR
jgi:AcrR family transcriptional regulator